MSKQIIEKANEAWSKSVIKATATNKGFMLHVAINEISFVSYALGYALGCVSGMKLGEDRKKEAAGVDR